MQLRLFEAFWNSGAGLIGEEGAQGWSAWMTGGPARPPQQQEVEAEAASPGSGPSAARLLMGLASG